MEDKKTIEITGLDQPANLAQEFHVSHTNNEFLINMIEVIPQMGFRLNSISDPSDPSKIISQQAHLTHTGMIQKVNGRFVLSPAAMKKFLNVLSHNVQQFEAKFGEIVINPPEGLQ